MLLYRVDGQKRNHDRSRGFIFPIFRVIAVVLVLTDFETARSAEHHVDNSGIAEKRTDPFGGIVVYVESGDEDTGPEDHLAKIIGAAHDSEQACIDKTSRVLFLCAVFLQIRGSFQKQTGQRDQESDQAESICALIVLQPEKNRGSLQNVKNGCGNPYADFGRKGHTFIGFYLSLHPAGVGGFQVAIREISGEPAAVDDEQHALQDGSGTQTAGEQAQEAGTDQSDSSSVTQGNEPYIFAETAGAGQKGQKQKNQKLFHKQNPFVYRRRKSTAFRLPVVGTDTC